MDLDWSLPCTTGPGREDLSHYETFSHFHATFYRHVEPLSVTPFSERALDKGLTGVLVASIRQNDTIWNPNDTARLLEQDDPRISTHVADISERAEAVANSPSAGELVRVMASQRLDEWEREKSRRPYLAYQARLRDEVSLLKGPESGGWDHLDLPPIHCATPSPRSICKSRLKTPPTSR